MWISMASRDSQKHGNPGKRRSLFGNAAKTIEALRFDFLTVF
jgi:hypothetical protein